MPSHNQSDIERPPVIPQHVAIIMDGNGRWAKAHGLPRTEGHRYGKDNLRRILEACGEYGIKILTIYAFSTENWERPPAEVSMLMSILNMVLDREVQELHEKGVQVRHIGKLEGVEPKLQKKIVDACNYTRNNTKLILNVAFNYGGRDEIVHAVKAIIEKGIPAEEITEAVIEQHLYTSGIPDPELIIRTSGELRISNFLLWQGAYSEYYATPVYWPDFDKLELSKALWDYSRRQRRFGMTDEQIGFVEQTNVP
jgi:undecaprenyl diphosphate synthase